MSGEITRFIQYWQDPDNSESRERILGRRRERYHTDEGYREAKKKAARKRYKKRERVSNARGPNKPRVIQFDTGPVLLLSLGAAAGRFAISKGAFRRYDDSGVLPRNRLIDFRGRRWYPEAFINLLAPIFADQRVRKDPLWRLKQRVEETWREAGGTVPVIPASREKEIAHGEEAR